MSLYLQECSLQAKDSTMCSLTISVKFGYQLIGIKSIPIFTLHLLDIKTKTSLIIDYQTLNLKFLNS
jgi:hypothetical protein